MPTNSTNFNIPKPVATDAFNLTNYNAVIDAIDANIKTALTGVGGVAIDISNTDLNNLDVTGFYKGNNLTNKPGAGPIGEWYYVINIKHAATFKAQIAVRLDNIAQVMYQRVLNNGTWSAWSQLATYDANGKVAVANLPTATTSVAGISQLADSISDTSTTKAATANSVKLAVDWVKGFGIGGLSPTVSDANAVTETGFYTVSGTLSNFPAGVTGASLIHMKRDGSRPTQLLIDYIANIMYFRSYQSTGWTVWATTETTTGAQSKADAVKALAQMVKNSDDNGISLNFGGDLNTLFAYGDYYVTAAATNRPSAFGGGLCMVRRIVNSTNVYQIMIDFSTGAQIIRYWNGTTWNFTNTMETASGAQTKATTAETNAINFAKGFGLGDVVKSLTDGIDLNIVDATGFYYATNATNRPLAMNGYLLHQKISAVYKSQTYIANATGVTYQRVNNNGTWTAWAQIVTDQKTAWTNLTLQNSWVAAGAPYPSPSYRKNSNGEIELRGQMQNGVTTAGTILANLPVGFRPTHNRMYTVAMINGAVYTSGVIVIQTNGDIIGQGLTSQLFLDSIPPIAVD